MKDRPLDEQYLRWLYGQVADVEIRKSSDTYWNLFKQLYTTQFTFFVPNDANRAMDGVQLRHDWSHEAYVYPDNAWMDLDCSFLEMLIALSIRASFQSDREMEWWFWHLLDNLEFSDYNDRSNYSNNFVTKRIQVVNERLYDAMGNGGLFPLRDPSKDQRKVELWYQLCEYLLQD